MKKLFLGDEAIAAAAIDAGLSGVYAYPGTPSTQITEYIQLDPLAIQRHIHSKWCTNEKTAMEAALGMSFAGKRALVCMKHVGMNVCADAFVNSAITGVNGGLVVVAADDPFMHSSQNEQDSRFYGKFAMVPIFEPSDQQECYDMTIKAFELSESIQLPVLLRIVTRLAHSRADVCTGSSIAQNELNASNDNRWVLLPAIARRQYSALIEKYDHLEEENEKYAVIEGSGKTGVIACGIAYNYVKESGIQASILKLNRYPLPQKTIRDFAASCDRILVVEEGQCLVEREVKSIVGADYPVSGRLTGHLPRTGELTPGAVATALGINSKRWGNTFDCVKYRPPQLCQGCGHRDVYKALNEVVAEYPGAKIFGDIGCYTLGALSPFRALASCVDMGASITMAKGAADAGVFPSIAIIGDSTFTHSGMTGLLDAVNCRSNITVIISDNLTTAMTGGQDSAGTNKFEAICRGLGVEEEHLHVVNPIPANVPKIKELIKSEVEYDGVSVIIPRRECMQTLIRHKK